MSFPFCWFQKKAPSLCMCHWNCQVLLVIAPMQNLVRLQFLQVFFKSLLLAVSNELVPAVAFSYLKLPRHAVTHLWCKSSLCCRVKSRSLCRRWESACVWMKRLIAANSSTLSASCGQAYSSKYPGNMCCYSQTTNGYPQLSDFINQGVLKSNKMNSK